MFCPECGIKNTQGLNYCTQCGANLNPLPTPSIPAWLTITFLILIGLISFTGLALPVFALTELGKRGFPPDMLKDIAAGGLAVTVAIDAMLIWLFLHLIKIPKPSKQKTVKQKKYVTSDHIQQQIASSPDSILSVTENTTRNFDRIPPIDHHQKETK
jgi:hypothetical protein